MSESQDRRLFLKGMGKAGGAVLARGLPAGAFRVEPPLQRLLDEGLRKEHPRLHLHAAQWAELRKAIPEDSLLNGWYLSLQSVAAKMLDEPPVSYKLVGPRLLTVSRTALLRIETLSGLYRLDGDTRKSDRARAELKAICEFPSWHPPHFLDVAEMTNAAALGYDWLYDVLSEDERTLIRAKIIEFGLRPGLAEYERGVGWSQPGANNWGQVCAGGLTLGALAIANDGAGYPEPAAILQWTTSRVRYAMTSYAPDGGWPEGPGYWLYATRYTCAMISALQSALGRDFGLSDMPGFAETGTFRMACIGPTGKTFNYADAFPNLEPSPEMFWLAKRFAKPVYAVDEIATMKFTRPILFHLLWSPPNPSEVRATWPPLDTKHSRIDLALFRSSWTDSNAFFVGFKGGDNMANHGHLDLGTFVMDAMGERWALDLGADDYDLPGYFGAQRWDYYRLRSEGHNVPTLGTSNQVPTAKAPMRDFVSTPASGHATVDLTEAYRPSLQSVTRQIKLERSPRHTVVVTDQIASNGGQTLRWNMHTRAKVELDGPKAMLLLNGKRLRAKIEAPANAKFEILSANVPKPQAQQPDVSNLIVNLNLAAGSTEIRIVFDAP
jgi:hypothetical protein